MRGDLIKFFVHQNNPGPGLFILLASCKNREGLASYRICLASAAGGICSKALLADLNCCCRETQGVWGFKVQNHHLVWWLGIGSLWGYNEIGVAGENWLEPVSN